MSVFVMSGFGKQIRLRWSDMCMLFVFLCRPPWYIGNGVAGQSYQALAVSKTRCICPRVRMNVILIPLHLHNT